MSRPQNPLNRFRTYNYHHILVACDSTETANALADVTDITFFERISHEQKDRYTPLQAKNGGNFIVVINSMTDVEYFIQRAKWTTMFNPSVTTGPQTFVVEGELEIVEPQNVYFLNTLANICKRLKSDPLGITFLLKTIFIGENTEGVSEAITNVKPFMFMIYDIVSEFGISGGKYTLSIVGVVDGVSRLPFINYPVDGFSFKMADIDGEKPPTLQKVFQRFEEKINERYQDYKEQLKRCIQRLNKNIDLDRDFRPVEYKIKLDPEYKNYLAGDNNPKESSNTGEKGDIIFVSDKTKQSIEGMINNILNTSKQILDERKKVDEKTGKRYFPSVTTAVKSTPEKFIVEYSIIKREEPVIVATKGEKIYDFQPDEGEGIEFDYIFTGGNIDIRDFNLRMQMAFAFFHTLLTTKVFPTNRELKGQQLQSTFAGGLGNPAVATDSDKVEDREKQPLFLGMSVRNPNLRNKLFPAATTSYQNLIHKFAAFESVEATVTINGNPDLLNETTLEPEDSDNERKKKIYRVPTYVKINVRMPTHQEQQNFSEQFWYKGWYKIISIEHTFDSGDFYQTLDIISIPVEYGQSFLDEDLCNEQQSGERVPTGSSESTTESQRVSDVQIERANKANVEKSKQ